MRNPKRNRLDRQLRNLRCPECGKLLARVDHGHDGVTEVVCRSCKGMVFSSNDGVVFTERDLTAVPH